MAKLHLLAHNYELVEFHRLFARYFQQGDALLFIGDAVTNLLEHSSVDFINQAKIKTFALKADCQCRGVSSLIPEAVEQIDDHKMVKLTVEYQPIISWK